MRKVGEAGLEDRLEVYRNHLEACRLEFHEVFSSQGIDSALQSQECQNIAQYGEVVRILEEVSGEDPVEGLSRISREAVDALRGADTPRWRSLALATVLEALAASV